MTEFALLLTVANGSFFPQTIKPIDAWANGSVAAHRSRLLALRELTIAECFRGPANKSASTTMK
jgi:hypothetical protein